MKDYSQYTLKDFVLDKDFQQWIINPNQQNLEQWDNYLKNHPQQKNTIIEAKQVIVSLPFKNFQVAEGISEDVWEKIQLAIKDDSNHKLKTDQTRVFKLTRNWLKYAAVFLLLTLAGFSYYFFGMDSQKVEYINQYGQIRQIDLPDGSKVILNANSRLQYNKNWEKREVWLDGEGYFDVKKTTDQNSNFIKFVVHTPELDVQVLGTKFNVKTRHQKTEVVLNSGRINIKKATQELDIKPGEMVIANKTDSKIEKQMVDVKYYATWREQKFAFHNTSLLEVLEMMKDNYGFEVKAEGELGSKKISSTALISTKNMEEFIQIVASLYQKDIRLEGKSIIIKQK